MQGYYVTFSKEIVLVWERARKFDSSCAKGPHRAHKFFATLNQGIWTFLAAAYKQPYKDLGFIIYNIFIVLI